MSSSVRDLYEKFPYPKIPMIARVRKPDSFLINYEASVSAAFGSTEFASPVPRILIVGAGTFEPYVVALANTNAQIVAIDISKAAIEKLKWRLRLHGLSKRVDLLHLDLLNLNAEHGDFHMIIGTGVLHHLENPSEGIQKLSDRLGPFGIMRLMLYSKFGRASIYRLRALREILGFKDGHELETFVRSLPDNHPLKIQFYLYGDSDRETGRQDAFFVPIDHAFDALDLDRLVGEAGLVITKYLHKKSGQPCAYDQMSYVDSRFNHQLSNSQKVALLDRLGELESNFQFLAVRQAELDYTKEVEPGNFISGNPVLQKNCPKNVYSKILDAQINIGPKLRQLIIEGMDIGMAEEIFGAKNIDDWQRALLLVRGKKVVNED